MGEFVWIAVLAYLINDEPRFERKIVATEAECVAMNKAATEVLEKRIDITAYGTGCVKINLIVKPQPKDPFKK